MKNTKKIIALISMVFVCTMLFVSVPSAKAQFVLASWDYPDEYGQGLYQYVIHENTTGTEWTPVGGIHYYNETNIHEWEVGYCIKLRIYAHFNSTLTGATDIDDGLNYQRLNITVTDFIGTELFSEDNLTCFYSTSFFDPILWFYGFEVVLEFVPDHGQVYTVITTYEVFW